jgi:hypothetical protein
MFTDGCITEYATQIKTRIMIGIPAFSHQLRPFFFGKGFFEDTKFTSRRCFDEAGYLRLG